MFCFLLNNYLQQLSQFWYDDLTADKLTEEVLKAAGPEGKIALLSCPTLFSRIKKSEANGNWWFKNKLIFQITFQFRRILKPCFYFCSYTFWVRWAVCSIRHKFLFLRLQKSFEGSPGNGRFLRHCGCRSSFPLRRMPHKNSSDNTIFIKAQSSSLHR